jgi:1-acyl-sn-glycerol-3-phosphate acyltransferase
LLATSGIGALADWTVFAALVAMVAGMTGGSVFAVAIVTCARLVPSVVLGPLLAPYSGIIGTRRTLALADALRGGIIALLPLVDGPATLAAALLALEFASALSAATRESAVSAGVDPRTFAAFNTATGVVTYGMLPVGGLVAAALGSVGTGLPFIVAGALHLANAATVASTPEIDGGTRIRRHEVRTLAGIERVRRPGPLRDTVAAATIGVVAIAMLFSVGSVVATDLFGGVERYGYLLALLGVGALIGAGLVSSAGPVNNAGPVNKGMSAASGLLLATMGNAMLAVAAPAAVSTPVTSAAPVVSSLSPRTIVAVLGVVVIGIGAAVAYVETQSRLQRAARAPEDFAAAFAVIKVGTVMALVAAPVAHAVGGTRTVAGVMVAVAGAGAVWYARRIEGRSIATVVLTALGRPLLRAAVRVDVQGGVPPGGAVLASNHPNYLDGPLMMSIDDRVRPVARPQTLPCVRFALRCSGALIVGRRTIGSAVDHLRAGGLVWLAPEGHMTGASLDKGRTGVARIAAAAGVPVVPVAIRYPEGHGPVGTVGPALRDWRPWRRSRVTVVFGAPMPVTAEASPEVSTELIMARLSDLAGVPRRPSVVLAA